MEIDYFQKSQTKHDRQHQKQLLGKLSADLDYLEVLASEIRDGQIDAKIYVKVYLIDLNLQCTEAIH